MKKTKVRLDDLVVKKGFAETKSIAQSLIISGKIFLEEKKLLKQKKDFLKLYSKFLIIFQVCVTSQISVNDYNLTKYSDFINNIKQNET